MTSRSNSARAGAGALLLAAAILAATAGVLGLAGAPPARAATDPFYLDLIRDGMQAYDRGDYATAAKQLRLACFGVLDDPERLAGCLTRLGLAQAAAGNADAFRETFRRIVEVENRFGAYTKTDLPPEVRAAFEQRALAAVPASTLDAIPVWKAMLSRKLEAQIAQLPPRERRRQLEERLAKEPRSLAWNLMLVDLDLAEGKNAPALARAEATVALAPRDARSLCARGLARAAGNRCGEAVADLETCSAASAAGGAGLPGDGPRSAAALLGCRVELGQWRQAEEQVRGLPAALRKDSKIAALMQRVAKHPSAPAGAGAAGANAKGATPAAGAARSTPSTGSPGPTSTTGATHAAGSTGSPSSAGSTPSTRAAGSTASGEPVRQAAGTGPSAGTAGQGQTAAKPPPAAAGGQSAAQPSSTTAAGTGAAATRGGATPAPAGGPSGSATAAAAPSPLPRPLAPLSAAERESMARSERLLAATAIPDLREALRLARELADAHPDSKEAQYLAGAAAYRNSRWPEAAAYFRRGGPPGDDHPELLFYMAVAFYEVGDQPGAASALKRSLPNLQKTPFVESYVKRILGQ
jgi:tetratricopeptide (TPR) repeat protein